MGGQENPRQRRYLERRRGLLHTRASEGRHLEVLEDVGSGALPMSVFRNPCERLDQGPRRQHHGLTGPLTVLPGQDAVDGVPMEPLK